MRIVDEILQPAREQELVSQAHLEHIDRLQRIIERFRRNNGTLEEAMSIVEKLKAEENQLNESIDRLVDYRAKALKYIEQLSEEEHAVMFRYYISGESWERISEKTFMSIRRVYLLRKSALKKLENLYLKGIDE
jgi:hypothetical protein